MPDVKSGLSTGPHNMEATDDALEAQAQARLNTAASRNIDASAAAFTPSDLLDVQSTDVASGITSANDIDKYGNTAADRESIFAEQAAYEASPAGQQEAAAMEAQRLAADEQASEITALRSGVVYEQFEAAMLEGNYSEAAFLLHANGPAVYGHVVEEFFGEDAASEQVQQDLAQLRGIYEQDKLEAAQADAMATVAKLEILAAAQRVAIAAEVAQERGLDPESPQARAWIADLERTATDAGADLSSLDGETYRAALRGADEVTRASVQAAEDAEFRRAVFFTDDTSVASGLRVLGGNGYQPVIETPDFRPRPVDAARLARAMSGRQYETGDQVREGITRDPLREGAQGMDAVRAVGGKLFEASRARAEQTARELFGSGLA